MTLKNPLLALLALCLLTPAVHALCNDNEALVQAQASLDMAKNRQANGVSNNYDFRMAEKALLELKICINPDDFESLKSLASNTAARAAIANAMARSGTATQLEADSVAVEKEMRSKACSQLQKNVEIRVSNGVLSNSDLNAVRQACAILN